MDAADGGGVKRDAVNEVAMSVVFKVGATVGELAARCLGKKELQLVAKCVFGVISLTNR